MWVSDGQEGRGTNHQGGVSILVVLDVGFRLLQPAAPRLLPDVSILVVLDVGFRHEAIVRDDRVAGYVSILVVLDVGFRHL